jgi:hypothetical protein
VETALLFSLFPYNSDKVKLVTCGPVAIPHSVSDGHVAVTADPNDPPPKLPADPPLDPPPDPSEASPDVNGDGTIDIIDLAMVAKAYGHLSEDPYYDSRVDFDNNGVIDITDIAAVAIKFHQAL